MIAIINARTSGSVGGGDFPGGSTWFLGLGQPDPEVEAERAGDLFGEVLADRASVDPTDQLPGQPAVGECVVAVRVPGSQSGAWAASASTTG